MTPRTKVLHFVYSLALWSVVEAFQLPSTQLPNFSNISWSPTYIGQSPYSGKSIDDASIAVALRTQRDLAYNATIDTILWPALNLSSAYFGNNYSQSRIEGISVLPLSGYRRLVFDVYWDSVVQNWQLCPLGPQGQTIATANISTTSTSISSANISSTPSPQPSQVLLTESSAAASLDADVQIGGFYCYSNNSLQLALQHVNYYVTQTNANDVVDLLFLIFNIHATNNTAASSNAKASPLSSIINSQIQASFLYTPANFTSGGQQWPTWASMIGAGTRLIMGFGTNSLTSSVYNPSADASVLFSAGSLNGGSNMTELPLAALRPSSTPPLTFNCSSPVDGINMADPNGSNRSSGVNWDWADVSDGNGRTFSYDDAANVSYCGFSPFFSSHFNPADNVPSDTDPALLLPDNILGTIWSWDVGEPSNAQNKTSGQASNCAIMQGRNGRWKAVDCSTLYAVACWSQNKWTISNPAVSFSRAGYACDSSSTFSAPTNAVENRQLFAALQAVASNSSSSMDVWINLNSGDNSACWVQTGQTCWWLGENINSNSRLITVSVVAGIIVLLIFAVFLYFKCHRLIRQRRASRRRQMVRKKLRAMDYVTIPWGCHGTLRCRGRSAEFFIGGLLNPSNGNSAVPSNCIVLVSEAILLLGYSYFTDLAYNTWCSITGNDDTKKQRKLKRQILELKGELGRTSSQDEFAKWAKIRRKLDTAVAELEKMNNTIGSRRASFDIKVKSLLWTITNLSQFVLVAWYRKTPVFYLPKGWFPGWIERVLSLPFAPRGSVSVTIWFMTCRRLINNVIGLAKDFLEKGPPFGAAAKTPVSASSASIQPLRSNPLAGQSVRKEL
ncbi:hypothetical protein BZG36_04759 [Bifiguratus adelaidae]|uniref:Maintenance of telomere capping protein 6 n=1 Tax=Bifiguratus adelaidae TaxID=1938954 RepID=A0A261XV36_9FUNG|nr:hypothetical protein BZG36_04759 [Bifiguratus adelaidae]